jgi:hypothetical protein
MGNKVTGNDTGIAVVGTDTGNRMANDDTGNTITSHSTGNGAQASAPCVHACALLANCFGGVNSECETQCSSAAEFGAECGSEFLSFMKCFAEAAEITLCAGLTTCTVQLNALKGCMR